MQRNCLLLKYEHDKMEQYSRRENLRISGWEEEEDESEEVLEAKVIEHADTIGVKIEQDDISVVHHLRRPREGGRPVIVSFCHRKKRNEIMQNKKKKKNWKAGKEKCI